MREIEMHRVTDPTIEFNLGNNEAEVKGISWLERHQNKFLYSLTMISTAVILGNDQPEVMIHFSLAVGTMAGLGAVGDRYLNKIRVENDNAKITS